jgi:two-component system, cell cycle sensor histidine kinase and response regulator CckA
MGGPLKVLLIEDSEDDAELLRHALARAGYSPTCERVQNAEQMASALTSESWDLVISDYVLPSFSGLEALKTLQDSGLELPFIIISGKIGEEVAVEALKAGANDYLLKDRLTRLGPAIDRAIREASQRQKRRQAENALRESEERYRRLVESCPEAMFICVEMKFVYVNPAAVRMFGVNSPLELVGKPVLEFVEVSYHDLVEEYFRQALDGMDGPLLEHKLQPAKGQPILVETIARLVQYHGEPAVQMLSRDVGTRKQLEADLLNARKMEAIARLAGGVANDFNNLLTVITGYTGLLRSALGPEHPLQKDLQQITNSTERAISMTTQLLALSRKEAASPQPVNLNTVIEQTLPLLKRLLGENIECVASLVNNLHETQADRGQIETVIFNLAVHARDSMPKGGKLYIETSNVHVEKKQNPSNELKPGEYVLLEISDTGQGFSDDFREHVFEPFYVTAEIGRNNGLGLATVYAVVKQHGGHIWCTSEIGKGSTFQIYLPRFAPAQKPTAPRKVYPVRRSSPVIMVVEDEDVLRDFANLVLRKNGYHVLTARNGHEALTLLESLEVNLIFTDVVMPKMGGAELARRLADRQPHIPIVYTSGYPKSILSEAGVKDDQADFLQKPYTTTGLLEKIRQVLSNVETS